MNSIWSDWGKLPTWIAKLPACWGAVPVAVQVAVATVSSPHEGRASIVVLTVLAAALLLAAGGEVSVLVPLFAIGVFVGFALCQAGMMRHWWTERSPRWRQRASLNLLGTVLTGAAAVVLVSEKFIEGAWLIVLVIPLLVGLFATIRRAYARIGAVLEIDKCPPRPRTEASVVVVPVVGISRMAEESLSAALSMGDRVVAVHVRLGTEPEDRAAAADLQRRWQEWRPDVALVRLLGVDEDGAPSRVLGPAIARYLRELAAPGTERVLLLIGEVAPNHWWEQVLFNRRGAVVARYAGRHTNAVVCLLRFRLLPRTSGVTPTAARRPRGLVLPRR